MLDLSLPPESLSVAFVRGLVEAVQEMGVGRDELLQGSALTVPDLARALDRLPRAQLDALVERAIALTEEPALGLVWWDRASFGAFGVVGHALAVSASFRSGLSLIERYWPMFMSQPLLTIHERGNLCRVIVHCASPSPVAHRAYMEASAFALCRFLRQCAGIDGAPWRVCFDFPAPPYAERYEAALRCAVRFDHDCTELRVHKNLVYRPHLNYAADLDQQFRGYADTLLAHHQTESIAQRVLEILRGVSEIHRVGMDDVAAALGMSERTLRRRLQTEGTPYPAIVQRALKERAETLLQDPARSIKEIAYALGFADPSAFHRAFRRWTGQAPSALRNSSHPPPK